uniref:Putative secreted peptide n=1 Tax=Rhipicephalus pulchellus TaxID=72859 RepID=L7M998_RHIPC
MKSTRTFARKATAAVVTGACVLIVSLSTASGQDVDRCDPSSVRDCYVTYMTVLWREEFKPSPEGEYDEEELKRGCSLIKEKFPCHQYLANCSEAVTGDHRIQERGYETLRNIMCDVNTLKESHTAIKCLNVEKMEECARTLAPTSNPQDAGKPPAPSLRCNKNPAEIACFDQAFNSSCPLSMTTAKAAVTRVVNAAALLKGCESSANAVVVSRGFLVLLVVPFIMSWLST